MVRRFRKRPSPFHGRDRAGRALDRPGAHLQHLLPRLPRQPAPQQLRPRGRLVPDHLGRARHQLRNLPRARRGAHPCHQGGRSRKGPGGSEADRDQDVHARTKERHVRALPRQDVAHHGRVPPRRSLLRLVRSDWRGEPGFLPRRPGPRGDLHLHLLAPRPLREVGTARLPPLPHLERPLPVQRSGQTQPGVPALPRGQGAPGAGPQPSSRRQDDLHRLPHAEDGIRAHGAQRPFDAAALARRNHRLQVPERLQPVPPGQGRRLERPRGQKVARQGLPGAGTAAECADRGRAERGLVRACRHVGRRGRGRAGRGDGRGPHPAASFVSV